MKRRTFLRNTLAGLAGISMCGCPLSSVAGGPLSSVAGGPLSSVAGRLLSGDEAGAEDQTTHPAMYAESLPEKKTHCLLCPNSCVRPPGGFGKCRVRGNVSGNYRSFSYGHPCVLALDPLEKCPLFHFQVKGPGLSIATAGCNLACQYCQNWQFSQKSVKETRAMNLSPTETVEKALAFKAGAISFFYTEPTIYIEYMREIAALAKGRGLPTVMVTGGYINPDPLRELLPLIDAFVVGLKGFSKPFYRDVVGGTPGPVLRTLKIIHEAGKHLEIVTLLVPTLNDDATLIRKGIDWICRNLSAEIPLHFTRFIPQFKLKGLPPTPVPVLETARNLALKAGMPFVYTGNVPGHEGNHTYCSGCGAMLIERLGFQVLSNTLVKAACPACKRQVPGKWLS